jgi:putative ABC transport system permease protein
VSIRMPTIFGLDPGLPFSLYWWRLRRRAAQELLAAAGISIGVGLVFGVLVANTSINGSVKSLIRQLIGSAQIQLVARSSEGMHESVVREVEAIPGVQAVSPILRQNVTLIRASKIQPVQLIGVTVKQLALDPTVTRGLGNGAEGLISGGVALPQGVAEKLGVQPEDKVQIGVNGAIQSVPVRTILRSQAVGTVASSPVAISVLHAAQQLTGSQGRITSALIKVRSGAQNAVTRSLRHVAAGEANIEPADGELRYFDAALKPNQQSTLLFAVIAGMVGFLLALNAMLMTVPERRRLVAELRTFGYDARQIVLLLTVQAVILGLVGSTAGIVVGDLFARTLFGEVPSYLTAAFPVGGAQIVTVSTIAIAVACGVLAALLASARPLLDLRPGKPIDSVMQEQGEAGQRISAKAVNTLAVVGAALVVVSTLLALVIPSMTIFGGALLALAAPCLVPCAYARAIALIRPASERSKRSLSIAVVELEATATRSIALAAIAALAVYGSVAIGGARADLTHGLEVAVTQYEDTADLWVTPGSNVFNTDAFRAASIRAKIARTPAVAAVRADQGALLDQGKRRLLIRVHEASTPGIIQTSQVVQGEVAHASRLLRHGGWATVSQGYASEHHLQLGSHFVLPTPSGGLRLRVAAITTNLGWPVGAIGLLSSDYIRGWNSAKPTALEVVLKPGVPLAAGRAAVQSSLGRGSALQVQTYREREAQTDESVRQGLRSLGRISILILISGALAVAASLSASIWQRRARLAAMKTWGYDHIQLWRSLLTESLILLIIGCTDGAVLGLYGHSLADRWLRLTTDFPAPFAIGAPQMFLTLAILTGIAMLVLAVPGLSAAQVSPAVSFQE